MISAYWCVVDSLFSQGYDLRFSSPNDCQQVIAPHIEGLRLLALVAGAIVDTGNTGLGAADMVQKGLNHMRLNADVRHAGGRRAPQVVWRPVRQRCPMFLCDPPFQRRRSLTPT